jgi:hypothetical protein
VKYLAICMVAAACFWGCGSGDSNKTDTPNNDNNGSDQTGEKGEKGGDQSNKGGNAAYYGLVQKCLVDAEEKEIGSSDGKRYRVLDQAVMCSPTIAGSSFDDVTNKLNDWKKTNCPAYVNIRNGTEGDYKGMRLKSFGAQNHVSNNQQTVEGVRSDKASCVGGSPNNYGMLERI